MEPDEVNVVASAVFRDLKEIQNAEESRLARQLRSDVGKSDGLDRIHLDLSLFHPVSLTRSDAGTHPDSHAAGDFPAPNSVAKALRENHKVLSLRAQAAMIC